MSDPLIVHLAGPNMPRYYVDSLDFRRGNLQALGWLFHPSVRLARLDLVMEADSGTSRTPGRIRQERGDVHADHPFATSLESGFKFTSSPYCIPCQLSLAATFEDGTDTVIPLGRLAASASGTVFHPDAHAKILSVSVDEVPRFFEEFRHFPFVRDTSLGSAMGVMSARPAKLEPLPEPVDLLIPAYNVEPFFESFFGSLLRNTSSPYRLVIVDDDMAGERQYHRMCEVAARVPGSIVLRNDENRGFLYSICRAFENSKGHFVILNVDTELPPGWLERIMAPIFADPERIASATPFTNAGAIASFPDLAVDNAMFLGLDTERLDRYFARVDAGQAMLDIVSGVGFCMGFNRRVVDRIGFFDTAAFGRGYSEENDWSLRARAAGYRNVLIPNLFVRHEHGACFLPAEKRALLKRNLAIVEQRYPGYRKEIQEYYKLDPALRLRQAVALSALCGEAPEGTVLVIDHALGGGANHYRAERVAEWESQGRPVISALIQRGTDKFNVTSAAGSHLLSFPQSALEDLVTAAPLLNVREVLVNCVVSSANPLAILSAVEEIRRQTGAFVRFAGHDFHSICPSYTLLDHTGTYCDLPGPETCATCALGNERYHGKYDVPFYGIDEWRKAWGHFLGEVCSEIECYSRSSRDLFARAFPGAASRLVVRPHSVDHVPRAARLSPGKALHVGILGAIGFQKGAELIRALADLMAERDDGSRLTVIGAINATLNPAVATVTGRYKRDHLVEAIEESGANVFLVPAIWPETFSYVTEELVRMGVPVAVSDMGALPERVHGYARGIVLKTLEPAEILEELRSLFESAAAGAQ